MAVREQNKRRGGGGERLAVPHQFPAGRDFVVGELALACELKVTPAPGAHRATLLRQKPGEEKRLGGRHTESRGEMSRRRGAQGRGSGREGEGKEKDGGSERGLESVCLCV
jgi:hypothetical protein